MHVADGALTIPVVFAGGLLALVGVGLGVRRLDSERIPTAGVLSAALFVAGLVHVPIGPTSIHLTMSGLAGLVLGWAAFPTIFIALLMQAVLFGFGGITVLGVNTVAIALPAVLVYFACHRGVRSSKIKTAAAWGALAGGGSIALTGILVAVFLSLSGEHLMLAAKLVLITHIPILLIEATLCAAAVILIKKVKPELFHLETDQH